MGGGEGACSLSFSLSWGLGCHATLWMNFSSVLAVSIKTLLLGWEIGIIFFRVAGAI